MEYDTESSRVITDLSTYSACRCLTSQIGRDVVFSPKYGRTQHSFSARHDMTAGRERLIYIGVSVLLSPLSPLSSLFCCLAFSSNANDSLSPAFWRRRCDEFQICGWPKMYLQTTGKQSQTAHRAPRKSGMQKRASPRFPWESSLFRNFGS